MTATAPLRSLQTLRQWVSGLHPFDVGKWSPNQNLLSLGNITKNMDVSKNMGTPKWMVKIMEILINMDDLGGVPLFLETPI